MTLTVCSINRAVQIQENSPIKCKKSLLPLHYFSKSSESPLIWNTATIYCKCNVYCVNPCKWACRQLSSWSVHAQEHGQLQCFIFHQQQMTLDLMPLMCLFSSYSSLYPITRINLPKHIITCAPVHIILRFGLLSSVLLLYVHTDKCVLFVLILWFLR